MDHQVNDYPIPAACIYCGSPVALVSNAVIYGREFGSGKCYKCTGCDSYVGVHPGTTIPMGRLADKELRVLKQKCHVLFDAVWRSSKRISREQAYGRLANVLGIPAGECHFGWFDKPMLERCLIVLNNEKWYIGVAWKQAA